MSTKMSRKISYGKTVIQHGKRQANNSIHKVSTKRSRIEISSSPLSLSFLNNLGSVPWFASQYKAILSYVSPYFHQLTNFSLSLIYYFLFLRNRTKESTFHGLQSSKSYPPRIMKKSGIQFILFIAAWTRNLWMDGRSHPCHHTPWSLACILLLNILECS